MAFFELMGNSAYKQNNFAQFITKSLEKIQREARATDT